MHKLSASIVIYKSNRELLSHAINSFLASAPGADLYLIDNSPTDAARSLAVAPNIRYIFNGANLGFGAAHNLALKAVLANNSQYHVILNPDVYFSPDVIGKLWRFMESDPEIGLVAPKVLYPDGRLQHVCRLLPSPLTLIRRRLLHRFKGIYQKLNHDYEMHFTGYNRVMDVPFLSGCFMFLRVEALRTTGLFDERIFLYTEDIDLTRRLHRRYRTVFNPDVTIYHHHVRRSYKSLTTFLHHAGSAVTYFNKWGWFTDLEREEINRNVILKFVGATP
jgi:GT2 family glycosyltransferase